MPTRCAWATTDLSIVYHDREWGVPTYDDRVLFEFLILEGAQAGLSWETILRKRENYRAAFDNFKPEQVAKYNQQKVARLLTNEGIIRNRLKIAAAIQNAKCFIEVQREFGSFATYLWRFVNQQPVRRKRGASVPVNSPLSDALSKDLAQRGFKFVGTTICYSYMQAIGLINDHDLTCFRYQQVNKKGRTRSS